MFLINAVHVACYCFSERMTVEIHVIEILSKIAKPAVDIAVGRGDNAKEDSRDKLLKGIAS